MSTGTCNNVLNQVYKISANNKLIVIDNNAKQVLDEIREALQELSYSEILVLFYPRCPVCASPLIQKMASGRLYCVHCGREYTLKEISSQEGDQI